MEQLKASASWGREEDFSCQASESVKAPHSQEGSARRTTLLWPASNNNLSHARATRGAKALLPPCSWSRTAERCCPSIPLVRRTHVAWPGRERGWQR